MPWNLIMAAHIKFETRHYPKLSTLEIHAGKLAERLSVQLSHAYEMLAFYYNCRNWTELKSCASQSIAKRENNKGCGHCHRQASDIRELLAHDIQTGKLDVDSLNKITLQPDSIACHLYNQSLNHLFDDEIFHIHSVIYEESNTPRNTPLSVVSTINNSISTLFNQATCFGGQWLYDYRYGTKIYCSTKLVGDKKTLIIREFDSLFYPPTQKQNLIYEYKKSFELMVNKSWFPKYVLSYLSWIIKNSVANTDIDSIAIYRICNIDLMTSRRSITAQRGIEHIAKGLINLGATPLQIYKSDTECSAFYLNFK